MNKYAIAGCLALSCASAPLTAKEPPEWRSWANGDRFAISVGAFNAAIDTKIALDSQRGDIGTSLDLERDLGLEDSKLTPIVSFKWNMAKRHRLLFNYFRLDRSGDSSSDVAIRFGDEVFAANVPIQADLDIKVFEIDYAYSVLFRERHNLAIGAGLSLQDLKFSISGRGEIEGFELSESVSVPAPLPTLILSYNFAIVKKLLLDVNIGWLALALDSGDEQEDNFWDFDGAIWNSSIALQYKAFKHVGFKFGYQRFSVDAKVDDDRRNLTLEYVYQGPSLSIEGFF